MKKTILFFLLTTISVNIFAQKPVLEFEEILDNNGNSFINVMSIKQDAFGFMWFFDYGYQLCRYDGNDALVLENYTPFTNTNIFVGKDGHILASSDSIVTNITNINFSGKSPYSKFINKNVLFTKLVEDGNGNLWGQYGNTGLFSYNIKTDALKTYYSKYSEELLSFINSDKNEQIITELTKITNSQDKSINFSIDKDKEVLIACSGEAGDYGFLMKDNDTIWIMKDNNTLYAGGASKNRFVINILNLSKGNYTLHYKSDDSHSYNNWNDAKPTNVNFYGCRIFEAPNNFKQIDNHLLHSDFDTIYNISTNKKEQICIFTNKGLYVNQDNDNFDFYKIDWGKLIGEKIKGNYSASVFLVDEIFYVFLSTNGYWNIFSIDLKKKEYIYLSNINADHNFCFDKERNGVWYGYPSLCFYDIDTKINYSYNLTDLLLEKSSQHIWIKDIDVDKNGNLFLATNFGVFKTKKTELTTYSNNMNLYSLTWRNTYIDSNKMYFFDGRAKNADGVIKEYDFETKLTKEHLIYNYTYVFHLAGIADITQNEIWLFSETNLNLYNKDKKQITDSLQTQSRILSVFKDSKKQNWLFTLDSIYLFDSKLHKIIPKAKLTSIKYDNNNIIDFVLEIDNNLFIRTYSGIWIFNTKTYAIKQIHSFNNKFKNKLQGNIFYEKTAKTIWFASGNGLFSYNISTFKKNKIDYFNIENINKNKDLLSVIPSKKYLIKYFGVIKNDNIIWLSTGYGFYKIDTDRKHVKLYTKESGLPSNRISDIYLDKYENLWLCTPNAVSKFIPKTEVFINYYINVQTTMVHNVSDSIYHFNDEVGFYGLGSIVAFNPNDINQTPPPVVITKFSLFDKEYRLDSLIHQKKQINLNYDQNFISFEFAALDYTNPKRNRYAYMLEGVDKEWIFTDSKKRFAEYKNLAPGKYTFRVKASNNDGIWNEEGIYVNIYIKPPWYKTILAYIFYVILFVAFIYLIVRLNSRRLIKQKEQLEKVVEKRTLEVRQQNKEINSQNEELLTQKQEIEAKNEELNQLIEEVSTQKEEITVQRDLATKQKEEIISSINYAKQIQQAVLPSEKLAQEILFEHFIFFKPRDIVSGDFYWIKQIKNFTIVVAADSTGHGVPGAFMSMLGNSFLNEIITSRRLDNTGEILNHLRTKIKKSLRQNENESKDGMDMALYIIDRETLELQYSGAYNPVYIIRSNEKIENEKIEENKKVKIYSDSQLFSHSIIELKADRQPVAIYIIEKDFGTQRFQLKKGDCLYTFSDGYLDQFGGEKGEKFMTKRFRNLLLSIAEKPMTEQYKVLDKTFENWKGNLEQLDDVLVMGIRI